MRVEGNAQEKVVNTVQLRVCSRKHTEEEEVGMKNEGTTGGMLGGRWKIRFTGGRGR